MANGSYWLMFLLSMQLFQCSDYQRKLILLFIS